MDRLNVSLLEERRSVAMATFPAAVGLVTLLLSMYVPFGGMEILSHISVSLAAVAPLVGAWVALTWAYRISHRNAGSDVDLLFRAMVMGAVWAVVACVLAYFFMWVWLAIGLDLGWFPLHRARVDPKRWH